jgi:bifunctional UDP-N-acetylglucosamine pyrophosphorylase/glucosamine-1-phosphate N-acetyltransferase
MASFATDFILQEPQLGTGHAVQQTMQHLGEDSLTLVLYGDVPLIQADTLKKLLIHPEGLSILTLEMENPTGYGRILRNHNGKVTAIVEEKDATPEQRKVTEVNTGILAAPTYLLRNWLANLSNNNKQGEYYLTDIVAMAVAQGIEVSTTQPSHSWEVMGINSKIQLAELERIWQQEQSQRLLQQGVTLADPARIDIRGALVCGRDVEIDIGCVFEGSVYLGNRVKVGAYSIIKDSKIEAGTYIAPYSHIVSAEIDQNCTIGPYARIRPGTKLHPEVHIGNFVEIKNSEIATGSKANHLSYIGDTSIGRHVNVGAGTITCNYDGVNKHRTIIEDNVFIGSDTQLIAPVTIKQGSTIGAGSTITRDTVENALTLSRAKQLTVTGWQRPIKNPKEVK